MDLKWNMPKQIDTGCETSCRTVVRLFNHLVSDALSIKGVVLSVVLLQGCASFSTDTRFLTGISDVLQRQFTTREISFKNPPGINTWLEPQPHLVVCKNEHSAVAMALTGLFVPDCQLLASANTYRVASITRRDFGDNQLVWMVAVDSPHGTQWVPVPWHDWA